LEAARWDSRAARAAAGAVRGDDAAANGHAGRGGGDVNPFPCWAEAAGNAGGGSCLEGGGSCPDWLTDPQAGYSPPTASEILPHFLLSPRAQQYVEENEANYYVRWNIYSFPAYGLYLSLSRKVVDVNLSQITGFGLSEPSRALPFYALWEDAASTTLAAVANPGDAVLQVACRDGFAVGDTIRVGEGASAERSTVAGVGSSIIQLANPLTGGHLKGTAVSVLLQAAREQLNAPAPIWIPGLGESQYELVPWLGCRCSWPCTQLCWRWLFMNTQALATVWMTVTVLFLWVLLEGLVMDLYILKVPGKTSLAHPFFWSDYVEGTQPFSLKMAMMLGYTVFPFFVLGFLFGGISKGTKGDEDTKPQNYLTSYFNTLYQLRILLRSLAARPETSTDSYCTLVYWTILVEIWTVVLPAYLPFLCPLVLQFYFEGSLQNISKLYVVFVIVFRFIGGFGLSFVQFLLCLSPDTQRATTKVWAGRRAQSEWRSAQYLYLWALWLFMLLIGLMMKWKMTYLWLWTMPVLALLYCAFLQGYEYCFAGVQACPPHTGPAIHCTQILTTVAFIAGFVFLRGCFLFPCLCAPELPAWLFFPPDNPPPNPIGEGDIDWQAAMLMLSRALRGFPPPEDCMWAPPVGEAPATELWRHAGAWGL